MSLARLHPIWTSCETNPWDIHKVVTACWMLSCRYLTAKLQRHWTWNRAGRYLLPSCIPMSEGSLEHILLHCPALDSACRKMYSLYQKVSMESAVINTIFLSGDQWQLMQLILDCKTLPEVIKITQTVGPIYKTDYCTLVANGVIVFIGSVWKNWTFFYLDNCSSNP